MTDYKKLCAELLSALESWSPGGGGPLERQEAEKEARLIERARAALAGGPAAPEGREPAAVTKQPGDEEIIAFWSDHCAGDGDAGIIRLARWGTSNSTQTWLSPADGEVAECTAELEEQKPRPDYDRVQKIATEAQIRSAAQYLAKKQHCDGDLIPAIRYAIARWGHQPAPPADGEVAELVAEIRHFLAGYQQMRGLDPEHIYSIHRGDKMEAHITVSRLTRAAELLQRQALVPVPDAERPWEREGWCDELGRCWWGRPDTGDWSADWTLATPEAIAEFCEFSPQTVCLPAHSLPLPEVDE